jgi:acetate kinase
LIILTLNCGSSSVKYQVYDWNGRVVLAKGMVERIGQEKSNLENFSKGKEPIEKECKCPSHSEAIKLIIDTIVDEKYGAIDSLDRIKAVGHRVVQGGDKFIKSTLITPEILETFRQVEALAPLHNPANILGIEAAQSVLPDVPHAAILDTAWHQTMPNTSFMYALPYDWYEKYGVRRYGFHGASFLYTAKRAAVLLGKDPLETNLIIAHIGNGASICAVKNGCSYDTSMGLTPLEGLIMGTRSGDMDPAIIPFLMNQTGLDAMEIDKMLNKKSGLLGITGDCVDRRDIQSGIDKGDKRCLLAQDMESYRIKKYIGAYSAALGKVDAVVFTAGVGEMNPEIRRKTLTDMENIGIKIHQENNQISKVRNGETVISTEDSPVKVFVIPTDEELVMTEDTYSLMAGTYDVHTKYTYSFQDENYVNNERQEALEKQIAEKPELKDILV